MGIYWEGKRERERHAHKKQCDSCQHFWLEHYSPAMYQLTGDLNSRSINLCVSRNGTNSGFLIIVMKLKYKGRAGRWW
jgi:hypothetical protein